MKQALSELSIYSIAHPDKLAKAKSTSVATRFSEKKVWRTGHALWKKTRTEGTVMPVLWGDATDCSRLVYWGILTKIELDDETTRYWVRQVRKIKGEHSPQELLLRTGKTIAPNFIKPYAICRTPPFLA